VNPAAGRGRTRRLLPRLRAALHEVDIDVEVSATPDEPERIARAAASDGRGIVACGGDGLVAALAGVAAQSDVPLAVVPTGAGNDFARALGLHPRRPLDAISLVRDGRERVVDLGRAGDRSFTSVANTGFDAEANRWANSVQVLSGTTLYLAAIVRTLVTYRPRRFRLTVDGQRPEELRAWLVAFANTPSYAGGMRIAPEATIDDGLLDVTVIGPIGRGGFAWNLPRVATGTIAHHPQVSVRSGRRFAIESLDDGHDELWASGERVGPLPANVEIAPRALRVLTPG